MKYILLPNGKIKENDKDVSKDKLLNDIIRLPNRENKEGRSNKFSELAGFSPGPTSLFENNYENNQFPMNAVVNRTSKLRNDSFGFVDSENNVNSNREIEFYNNYNTVFDLKLENFDVTDNINSMQIFANNLDIYGFPQILTNPIDFATRDTIFRVSTLIDSLIASLIPIITMSTLQYLLEKEISGVSILSAIYSSITGSSDKNYYLNEEILQLGSYISYLSYKKDENGFFSNTSDILNEILKKNLILTLQSFERIMNFPRFKIKKHEGFFDGLGKLLTHTLDLSLDFFVGYLFYLVPGIKSPTKFETISLVSLNNLIQSLLTSNSSRHNFDLLIRKILKNNYFFKISRKAKESKIDGELLPNFIESLSYYSTYFYRFIGERIGIGNRIRKIDAEQERSKNDRFSTTRRKDNKLVHSFFSLITNEMSYDDKYNNAYIEQRNINNLDIKNNYRVSKENLKKIENIIDLDYVPFSLHDLRNNDVIKFHAFIENVSDSFSSSYNEAGGYGRQEKIKTFINTTRSMNIAFRLVAISKEDHDEMWHVINKIVTMIYPQWSKGVPARNIHKEELGIDYKIPFTQLPSNTPMVRLRLGDLITSNYNKTSIANTFGFMKKGITKGYERDLTDEYLKSVINLILEKEKEKLVYEIPLEEDKTLNISYDLKIDNTKLINPRKINNSSTISILSTTKNVDENSNKEINFQIFLNKDTNHFYEFKISSKIKSISTNSDNPVNVVDVLSENINLDINISDKLKKTILDDLKYYSSDDENYFKLNNFLANTENDIFNLDQAYINHKRETANLISDQKLKKEILAGLDKNQEILNELKSQSSSGTNDLINNPITYAYESALGKGLAGHITSLGIDWDQETPWDIDEGSRAPMFVKITIGFAPVHDIPLGLDHNGTMRAVPYMVGNKIKNIYNNESFNYDENEFNSGRR